VGERREATLREATLRVVVVSANNVVIEVDKIASRASD